MKKNKGGVWLKLLALLCFASRVSKQLLTGGVSGGGVLGDQE